MQIKWVDDLLAVAQTKNFSRAADLRCVTQSALSRRIRSLEDWAGVELVDRSTYPVQLTAAGQTFCDQGREALAALIELRTSLRQDDTMSGRFVRIMASHTLSITFLPELLDRFQQTHAELNARVLSANIHDAAVALTEGRCDLMLTYSHPQVPILLDPDRFTCLSLGGDLLLPVCAPDAHGRPRFPLPGHPSSPLPQLGYSAGTFLGRLEEVAVESFGERLHLKRRHEADMAMHLMEMAIRGLGVAWLPRSVVASALADGKLVCAASSERGVALDIHLYRSKANFNPALQALWQELKSL